MHLLIVLSLACFAGSYSIRLIDPIIPELARTFEVAPAIAALLASAFTFPYALGQPILGPMADTVGKARVIKIGLGVLTLCLVLAALAPSLEVMFAARVLAGLAGGAIIPVAIAMIGDRVGYADRQVALSQLLSAMLVSQLASLIGTGLVASWFGWRFAVGLAAGVALAAFVVTLVGIKPRNIPRPRFRVASLGESYREVFANPRAKICYAAVFVEGVVIFGLLPYVAVMLEARDAGGIAEAGVVLACMGIGGLVFTLAVKRLLRQLGGMRNLIRFGGVIAGSGFWGSQRREAGHSKPQRSCSWALAFTRCTIPCRRSQPSWHQSTAAVRLRCTHSFSSWGMRLARQSIHLALPRSASQRLSSRPPQFLPPAASCWQLH